MSDQSRAYTATKLKEVEPGFDQDGKLAALKIENVDGAKFGSLLESKEALSLLHAAIRICQWLPPERTNPRDSSVETFVSSEIENIALTPGRKADEIQIQIFAGGLRLSFWLNLDLFLSHCGKLISQIERDPRVPDKIQ